MGIGEGVLTRLLATLPAGLTCLIELIERRFGPYEARAWNC
jgi:hypothetical protein